MKKNECKSNDNIICDVVSCKHNNCEEGTCTLKTVTISCSCDNEKCKCTEETICQSFDRNDKK